MPIIGSNVEVEGSAELARTLESEKDDLSRDVIQRWFQLSQDWLEQAASNRATISSEGKTGREENGLYAIHQYATPPVWAKDHWEFSYNHEGAVFQEFGAKPHEIRARRAEVLAFEWPDAPRDVKEQFDHTEGDLVFFESINHPGIPGIGFVRYGRKQINAELDRKGIDVENFGAKGDGE